MQAGTEPETDSATVRRLAEVPPERILPEAYVLPEPIAPHEAARRAGIEIEHGEAHAARHRPAAWWSRAQVGLWCR